MQCDSWQFNAIQYDSILRFNFSSRAWKPTPREKPENLRKTTENLQKTSRKSVDKGHVFSFATEGRLLCMRSTMLFRSVQCLRRRNLKKAGGVWQHAISGDSWASRRRKVLSCEEEDLLELANLENQLNTPKSNNNNTNSQNLKYLFKYKTNTKSGYTNLVPKLWYQISVPSFWYTNVGTKLLYQMLVSICGTKL